MVSLSQVPVNLPVPPDGLFYFEDQYDGGNVATTTGAFAKDSPNRKLENLRWLGVMVADFDLVDWLIHVENWSTDVKASKARLYTVSADELSKMKARHLDDVMQVVDSIVGKLKEQGACEPTYVIDSGYGCHLYFWLKTPATTPEQIKAVRAENAQLVEGINIVAGYKLADVVHDAGTRIMRKVGTVNTRGPLGMVCGVSGEYSAPLNRWSMEPSAVSVASSTGQSGDSRIELVVDWLSRDDKLESRFADAINSQDSESDASLASALARRNISPTMTAQLLFHVRRRDPKHDGSSYYDHTALSTFEFVKKSSFLGLDKDDRVVHDNVLFNIGQARTKFSILSKIAQHDPRINSALWVHRNTNEIFWSRDVDAVNGLCRLIGQPEFRSDELDNRMLSDSHVVSICRWITDTYQINVAESWRESYSHIADGLKKIDPMSDYLLSCVDKLDSSSEDLLETWLIRAFGVEDTPLLRVYSKKWLVGGAARALNPGVFIKGMLVFTGPQSRGKSTAMRILAGKYRTEIHPSANLAHKDVISKCASSWLIDFDEFGTLGSSATQKLKSFLTTCEDTYRPSYGRSNMQFNRSCFYSGSSNDIAILSDPTGSDRFWCVNLTNSSKCDFEWLRSVRDTLWGQAAKAWIECRDLGESSRITSINLTDDELCMLREANMDFESSDPNADNIESAIFKVCRDRKEHCKDFCYITLEELFNQVVNKGVSYAAAMQSGTQLRDFNTDFRPAQQTSFKNTLTRLGFASKTVRLGDTVIRAYALTPAQSKVWMDLWAEEAAEVVEIDRSNITEIRSKWNESVKTANVK